MKFSCILCNYETNDKSNYNRHLNSNAHTNKNKVNNNIKTDVKLQPNKTKKYQCPNCLKIYTSAPGLSRHKNNYCHTNIITELKEKLTQDFNEKLKQKDLIYEKEKVEIENKLLKDQVKKLEDFIKSGKAAPTYNISVVKYIQQNYPDAPHIAQLEDYSIMEDDEEELITNLIDKFNDNQLDTYFGEFIISNYKKNDPSDQSIWNSDTSRLTYIIKELMANNKSSWNKDFKGAKTKNYIIDSLLNYIKNLVSKYADHYYDCIEEEIDELTQAEIIDYTIKGNNLKHIEKYVIDSALSEDILKYLAPHFQINKPEKCLITE